MENGSDGLNPVLNCATGCIDRCRRGCGNGSSNTTTSVMAHYNEMLYTQYGHSICHDRMTANTSALDRLLPCRATYAFASVVWNWLAMLRSVKRVPGLALKIVLSLTLLSEQPRNMKGGAVCVCAIIRTIQCELHGRCIPCPSSVSFFRKPGSEASLLDLNFWFPSNKA